MNDSVMQIEVKHVVRSMSRLILKILGTLIRIPLLLYLNYFTLMKFCKYAIVAKYLSQSQVLDDR